VNISQLRRRSEKFDDDDDDDDDNNNNNNNNNNNIQSVHCHQRILALTCILLLYHTNVVSYWLDFNIYT